MPRRARVFVAGAWYHVYCRVGRHERPFDEPREAAALVSVIREVKRDHGLGVAAWCVMGNHYHLALRAGRLPLWRSMRLIQGRTARGYNRRHRVLGPFWQSRYKAIVVEDERYLEQLIAYIHLNPVKAKAAGEPADARWSGHRELLGRVKDPLADVDEALALFGSRRAAARLAYARMLRGERRTEWAGESPAPLPWWRRRVADDEPIAPEEGVPRVDALGASTVPARRGWSVGEFVAACCRIRDVERAELAGRRKDADLTRTRELVTVIGVEAYGLRVRDLAGALGVNAGSASRTLGRALEREREDRSYHHERLALEQRLAEIEAAGTRSKKV